MLFLFVFRISSTGYVKCTIKWFFFQFVVGGTVITSIIPRKFHKSYIVRSFEKQTKQVQRQCTRRGVPLFRLVLEFIRRFRNTLTINRRCFQFMLSVRFFLQAQIQVTVVSSTSNITYTLGGIKSFSLYWETGNQNKTVCLRLLKIQIKKNVYDIKVLFFVWSGLKTCRRCSPFFCPEYQLHWCRYNPSFSNHMLLFSFIQNRKERVKYSFLA